MAGPEMSKSARMGFYIAGVVLGGMSALLGTVTHSGGIDGGITGVVVALLTILAGSAAFLLLSGSTGWVCYGLGLLLTLLLSSMHSDGDGIGTINQHLTTWWSYGAPAALLLGVVVAWIGYFILGADQASDTDNTDSN